MAGGAGAFPMGPAPAVLAAAHAPSSLMPVQLVTALAVVLLAGGAWRLLRRRSARAAQAVLLAGALLAVGAFVPAPSRERFDEVSGVLTGEASFAVAADRGAPVVVEGEGAQGRVATEGDGKVARLSCPSRCAFRIAAAVAGPDLEVRLDGGPLFLREAAAECVRMPFTLRLLFGWDPRCGECGWREWVAGAGGPSEPRRLAPSARGPAC